MRRLLVCVFAAYLSYGFTTPREADSKDLLDQISRARKELKDERVQLVKGVVGTRRVRVGRRKYQTIPVEGIVAREMAIAVMDSHGEIAIARAIKKTEGFFVHTPGITLSMRRENGINSDFAVIKPAGGRVLAVKYPVDNARRRFGGSEDTLEVVYTPYSAEIATDAVVAEGIEVQRELIHKAFSRLKERRVYSRAFPGKPLVDVIPEEIVTVLLMNEHIDPSVFTAAGLAEPLVRQVLTIIATNKERAYAYSISPAGARGLVQMIASTYSLMRAKYPEARLNPDFISGMSDSLNALMAQVLLCDADWQSIRSRADIPAERIGPYLAAAYNGGVGRVLSLIANEKTDWMEAPESNSKPTVTVTRKVPVRVRSRGRTRTVYVVRRYTKPVFRAETSKYVRQYHWINDFFVKRGVRGFDQIDKPAKAGEK
ncbi:MAG TPA: hypothetical protein VG778_07225 [Blastocatellia bacterium]|jgi:hypothetical protein|nr:hypothetical protein [Blastocatellia bacterium]